MAINNVTQSGIKDLNLQRFRSTLDQGGSLAKGCRYIVVIRPPQSLKSFPQDLHYLCEAADFPGRAFSISTARYYGPSQMFPSNSEYQPLSLVFLCRTDSRERRFFDDWLDYINPVNTFNFEYPNNYYSEINLYQYAEWGNEGPATNNQTTPYSLGNNIMRESKSWTPHISYQWRLHKAWPTVVNEQAVNWGEQDILRLQVTFAYRYWDRPTLISGNAGNNGDSNQQTSTLQTNISFA